MFIQEGTALKTITVQGVKVDVPQPYAAGHALTESEAQALNQVLAENLRNNQASQLRKAKDEAEKAGKDFKPDADTVQKEMDEYVTEYEFGARRSTGTSTAGLDPVEKEMNRMAKEVIKTALMHKGYKLKDIPKETMDNFVADYLSKNEENLRANATQVIQAREAVDTSGLDLSGI